MKVVIVTTNGQKAEAKLDFDAWQDMYRTGTYNGAKILRLEIPSTDSKQQPSIIPFS